MLSMNFSADPRGFECETEGSAFRILTNLQISDRSSSDYYLMMLERVGTKESDIFQVYDAARNTRIGWCIPINALSSNSHDSADNAHFLNYASIAHRLIIASGLSTGIIDPIALDGKDLEISSLFPSNSSAFVISKSTLPKEERFNFESLLIPLSTYGYLPYSATRKHINWPSRTKTSDGRLNIHPLQPKNTISLSFANRIISDLSPSEPSDIARFLIIYQLLEFMMATEQEKLDREFAREFLASYSTPIDMKTVIKGYSDSTGEKSKLKEIQREYGGSNIHGADLLMLCLKLLDVSSAKKRPSTPIEAIYQIRNLAFHSYFLIEDRALFRDVTDCFEAYVRELTTEYLIALDEAPPPWLEFDY